MAEIELSERQTALSEADEKERHYAEAGRAMLEMSHAFKNILQMVGGSAEVIDYALRVKQMDKVEKGWSILNLNIKRLKKSLLDMLDFAKKQALDKYACDINDELKQTLHSLKWITTYKKFGIRVQFDAAMPLVDVDPERVGLMTLNLLLHAVDQVADHDGLIQLQTKFHPQQNQFAISITDNSPAYSAELQEHLFSPHETYQQRFSTGIGIALAQQIASQHEGRIELTCTDRANTLSAILPARTAQKCSG